MLCARRQGVSRTRTTMRWPSCGMWWSLTKEIPDGWAGTSCSALAVAMFNLTFQDSNCATTVIHAILPLLTVPAHFDILIHVPVVRRILHSPKDSFSASPHLPLQLKHPIKESFCRRGASRHVYIHGYNPYRPDTSQISCFAKLKPNARSHPRTTEYE